jgi:hypothetical protein
LVLLLLVSDLIFSAHLLPLVAGLPVWHIRLDLAILLVESQCHVLVWRLVN